MSEEYENKYQPEEEVESEYAFQMVTRSGKPKTIGWSLASLICGVAAIITSVFGWPAIVLGFMAIGFAIISKTILGYFDGKLIFGFIMGIHGVFIGIAATVLVANLGNGEHSNLWSYLMEIFKKIAEGPVS